MNRDKCRFCGKEVVWAKGLPYTEVDKIYTIGIAADGWNAKFYPGPYFIEHWIVCGKRKTRAANEKTNSVEL